MFFYIIFLSVLTRCIAVEIHLKQFDKYKHTFAESKEIVTKDVGFFKSILTQLSVHNFIGVRYSYSDELIDRFEDFGSIEYVWLEKNELNEIPVFKNLSKLLSIDLTRNHIKRIRSESFGSTPVSSIFLVHNDVSMIEDGSFGPKVCWLQLACNSLEEFSPKWFQNPSRLRILNLGGNRLSYVKPTDFQEFTSLNDLHLSLNNIKKIDAGTFAFTNHFQWLHLQGNGLREINSNIFRPSVRIDRLNIQYNNLTYLSDEFMKTVRIGSFVNILGNPWQCTCFEKIRRWTPWSEYGSDFFQKKNNSEPYCARSVESPLYCDPNPLDKEEFINIFAEAIDIPKRTEHCIKYSTVDFNPCQECEIC